MLEKDEIRMIKKIGICFLGIVLLLAAVILGYVLYMQAQYYRIEDFMKEIGRAHV